MAAAGKAVKTKLFIGNLDPATQTGETSRNVRSTIASFSTFSAELNELFASYGNVLEASVIKDYGFVVKRLDDEGKRSFEEISFQHYGTIEEAEKAVSGLNNKEFHGKRLRVEVKTKSVRVACIDCRSPPRFSFRPVQCDIVQVNLNLRVPFASAFSPRSNASNRFERCAFLVRERVKASAVRHLRSASLVEIIRRDTAIRCRRLPVPSVRCVTPPPGRVTMLDPMRRSVANRREYQLSTV